MKPFPFTLKNLLVVAALVFAPVLFFDFVNLDDPSHLDNHPYLSPLSVRNLTQIWTTPHLKLYIPLTYTTWSIVAATSGGPKLTPRSSTGVALDYKYSPFLFHFVNWICHLGSIALVYYIFRLLFPSHPMIPFATALFALHPVQVEPVAWVSGLKDTLSSLLFLGGLFSLLYGHSKNWVWIATSYLLCLAALLSKPSAVIWPAIAFLGLTHQGVPLRSRIQWLLLPTILSLPFAWMTARTQPTDSFGFPIPSITERIYISFDTIGFYATKLFVPLKLTVDYGRSPQVVLADGHVFFALLGIFIVLSGFILCVIRPKLRFAIISMFLFLVPVLGLKPFVFQTTSTVSDRYLYLVLFALGAAFLAGEWKPVAQRAAFSAIAALSIGTFSQTFVWKDTETLLTHAVSVQPRSWLAFNNLGSWNERKGNLPQALDYYRNSAAIKPQSIVFNNIGAVLMGMGRFAEAEKAYQEGIKLNPLSSLDYLGLGFALKEQHREKEARAAFLRAKEIQTQ